MQLEGIVSKRARRALPLRPRRRLAQDQVRATTRSSSSSATSRPTSAARADRLAAARLLRGRRAALRRPGRHRLGRRQERDLSQAPRAAVARDKPPLEQVPAEERRQQGEMGRAEARRRGRLPRLDRRTGWSARRSFKGMREDKPAKRSGAGGRPDARTVKRSRRRCGRRRRPRPRRGQGRRQTSGGGRGRGRHAEPSRPRLLGGRRRHQADARRVLHARSGTGCEPHVARPRARAGALSGRRSRASASSRSTRPPASTPTHLKLVPDDGDKSIAVDSVAGPACRWRRPACWKSTCAARASTTWRRPTAWCSISIPAPASNGRT